MIALKRISGGTLFGIEVVQIISANVLTSDPETFLTTFRLDAHSRSCSSCPTFSSVDLVDLPNFHTYVSATVDGEVTRPFSMHIIKDSSPEEQEIRNEIVLASRTKCGREASTIDRKSTRL